MRPRWAPEGAPGPAHSHIPSDHLLFLQSFPVLGCPGFGWREGAGLTPLGGAEAGALGQGLGLAGLGAHRQSAAALGQRPPWAPGSARGEDTGPALGPQKPLGPSAEARGLRLLAGGSEAGAGGLPFPHLWEGLPSGAPRRWGPGPCPPCGPGQAGPRLPRLAQAHGHAVAREGFNGASLE